MGADDALTEVATPDGRRVAARPLGSPPRHMFVALADADATYARQNSNRAWWHGWRTYERRKLEDFGRRPRSLDVRARQLRVDLYYFARTRGSALKRLWLRRAG